MRFFMLMRIAFWRMALPWWFLCGCIVAHDTASFAVWLLIKPQVQAAMLRIRRRIFAQDVVFYILL
ncbi:MAG: hypothetical protein KBG54_02890 [Oscillospiraceae bacterium]|nr:hypothetical protein [Oscillospiraceae bacterium]